MILQCKQLLDIIGELVTIDYSIDLSDYELFSTKPFQTPIKVCGKAVNSAGVVTLTLTTDFTLSLNCDRCLEPFLQNFQYVDEHILVSSLSTDNDDYILITGNSIDLDELVLSDILLNLPSKLLCSRDCKGLCPKCGANLNNTTCLCAKKEIDPRFAALSDLL